MSYFKAIMHQNRFRLELRPRLRWGAYSTPQDLLAGFKGPTSKAGEGGLGKGTRREGRRGDGKGREGRRGRGAPPNFYDQVYATGYHIFII